MPHQLLAQAPPGYEVYVPADPLHTWLPVVAGGILLVLLAVLFWIIRRSGIARRGNYLDRARQHMDALETKMDRMIALLENIDRKLTDKGPPGQA